MASGTKPMTAGVVEITNQVTFAEAQANNTHIYVLPQMRLVMVYYQGEGKVHATGDVLFTVPSEYKPKNQIYAPYIKNANAYGTLAVGAATGNCTVNNTSGSVSGRIYAAFVYPY